MSAFHPDMTTKELLKLVADNHNGKITISEEEKEKTIALLKIRAESELDYGEEIKVDKVRLIRRVTGAVGLYFK